MLRARTYLLSLLADVAALAACLYLTLFTRGGWLFGHFFISGGLILAFSLPLQSPYLIYVIVPSQGRILGKVVYWSMYVFICMRTAYLALWLVSSMWWMGLGIAPLLATLYVAVKALLYAWLSPSRELCKLSREQS